jgi:glutamate/tyrosine decarboxylase-like PLP-dependent enzyme
MSRSDNPLRLSADEMREIGYRVVDRIVDHLAGLGEGDVGRTAGREELEERLREPIPETGSDPLEVLEAAEEDVLGQTLHVNHPRFFGFVPGPGHFLGAMADALAAGYNVFAGTWMAGSGPAEVELVTLDWLRQLCGLPGSAGGLFTSGGSMANVTALATARHVALHEGDPEAAGAADGVVYASDQTHTAVAKGLRLLGFAPDRYRQLPTGPDYRLDPEALRAAVRSDRAAGRRPFCVVANAGTTNTGAVDPLGELATLCDDEGLWLHVDGAYGAAAAFCERGREALDGLGAADSLAFDPHKWLFQPFEIGGVLVRDRQLLKKTFQVRAEYLEDAEPGAEEVNFSDHGPQLSRSFRALKLWMTIKTFGRRRLAEAVRRGFERAEDAERLLRRRDGWAVVTPAQMGIVTFRCVPDDRPPEAVDALNRRLAQALTEEGGALLSTTSLGGRPVLRLCPIHPETTPDDIRWTLDRLEALRRSGVPEAGEPDGP